MITTEQAAELRRLIEDANDARDDFNNEQLAEPDYNHARHRFSDTAYALDVFIDSITKPA